MRSTCELALESEAESVLVKAVEVFILFLILGAGVLPLNGPPLDDVDDEEDVDEVVAWPDECIEPISPCEKGWLEELECE
jgi:hypothetical protein